MDFKQVFLSQSNLTWNIEHNGIEGEVSDLLLDTVYVLGVMSADSVYINQTQHYNFTFEESIQVCKTTYRGLLTGVKY